MCAEPLDKIPEERADEDDGIVELPGAERSPIQDRFDASLDSLQPKAQERYKLLRTIGFGGMKCVLLVHDRDTGRNVAMALMPDFRERPPEAIENFIREARITAFLEHPNIVSVHDIGLDSHGAPFYTMAFLDGLPLSTLLKRVREKQEPESRYLTLDRRLRFFLRVCNAVNYAHSRDICHLDIKPSNVIVGRFGDVRLIDWGIACETDEKGNVRIPGQGKLRGTPGYMAPEQISVNPEAPEAGKHSDIFSLGALLYAMLSTVGPFEGKDRDEQLYKTLTAAPPPLQTAAPPENVIPPEMDAICAKAMSKNPADRYSSVDELRQAVMNVQDKYFLASLNARHRRVLVSGLILLVFIVAALAAFLLRRP